MMISKEEALELITTYSKTAIIDIIYADIGTCGECVRGTLVDGDNDIDVVECNYEQTYSSFYEKTNFCADFVRKEDD